GLDGAHAVLPKTRPLLEVFDALGAGKLGPALLVKQICKLATHLGDALATIFGRSRSRLRLGGALLLKQFAPASGQFLAFLVER
ncbi:hypothetical protein ACTHT3_19430, partial [Neisseria sp. P0015.S004]